MLNPINEFNNTKPVDLGSRLKAKQGMDSNTEHLFLDDSISLSTTSKKLEALKALLRDEPEINTARVLYFQAEIQLGNYQIQSDKIAMKMFNQTEMA